MQFPCYDPATALPLTCHYPAILLQWRTRVGRLHAVSGQPMLIHAYHAISLPQPSRGLEISLSERHIRDMEWERHGMCESTMAALCKSNGKDTI
jgi:hypothetical protein